MGSLEGLMGMICHYLLIYFNLLLFIMQRAKHPRTIFDFASAKLEKKNETAKKKGQKVGEGYRMNKGEGILEKRNGCI